MNLIKVFSFALAMTLFVLECGGTKGNVIEPKPQTTCPVMGDKITCLILDKDIFIDYKGKRVYFCSNKCREKFRKNPEKYIKKMEDQGVIFEKAPGAKPED